MSNASSQGISSQEVNSEIMNNSRINNTGQGYYVANPAELEDSQNLAKLASRLLLISSSIVNFTKDDNLLVFASLISLAAGVLVNIAAFEEADAQQVSPGQTTFANKLKVIGTTLSLLVSLILLWALLIEISIRSGQTAVGSQPTLGGSTGSLITV